MKRLLFTLAVAASLAASAGKLTDTVRQDVTKVNPTSIAFSIPRGDTVSDLKVPFTLDRIEAAFLTGSKTLKMDRIRVMDGVPYLDHLSTNGNETAWQITEGTTYTDVNEGFLCPYHYWKDDDEYVQTGVYLGATGVARTEALKQERGSGDYYYNEKGSYVQAYEYDKYWGWCIEWDGDGVRTNWVGGASKWFYPTGVTYLFSSNAVFAGTAEAATNKAQWVKLGFPHQWKYVSSGSVREIRGHAYTGNWIDSPCLVKITTPVSQVTYVDHIYSNYVNYAYNYYRWIESRIPEPRFDGEEFGSLNLDYEYYPVADLPDKNNKYFDLILGGVGSKTNLWLNSTQRFEFEKRPGYVVTNFAVWATCSMTTTNTWVNATVGTKFETNLTDSVLLPGDTLRVSGTAMPTGFIIGIGRK